MSVDISTALRLEHPTLDALDEPTEPPTLRDAHHLLTHIRSRRGAIRSYHSAVDRVIEQPDDDIPF